MAKIQRQMCLSVPQRIALLFRACLLHGPEHQGHRIRAATGRAKIVHYHGLKVSRKREVAKSFCDLEARPERIVCQAVVDEMCQGFFPFDECYAAIARVLKKQALVIRCPIYPLSLVEKVPKCASLVRLSVAAWGQWVVSMPVFFEASY